MARSKNLLRAGFVAAAMVVVLVMALAQESAPPQASFYEIQISKDEIYSYKNLKLAGDYFSLESTSGFLVPGRAEVGITVVILLGAGSLTLETFNEHQEKFKTAFSTHPLKTSFKSAYIRMNPKEYAETFGKQELTKSANEEALTKAKEIYDMKFLGSYHAGPKAILPDYKTRRVEFETEDHGWIVYDEGYWLTLFRVSPYAKIYPTSTINPKQK